VFDAWTQPQHLFNWWRCNPAWVTPVAEVDLRVGGKYRLGMQDPEKDQPWVATGEFRVIDPPAKLVYTWAWEVPGMQMPDTLVIVEFNEVPEQTELVLTHEQFPDAAATAEHNKGWKGCLSVLAGSLESG